MNADLDGRLGHLQPCTSIKTLKPEHYDAALRCRAPGMWFEVHAESYMVDGGPRLAWLQAVRREHPLSLHGVSCNAARLEVCTPHQCTPH